MQNKAPGAAAFEIDFQKSDFPALVIATVSASSSTVTTRSARFTRTDNRRRQFKILSPMVVSKSSLWTTMAAQLFSACYDSLISPFFWTSNSVLLRGLFQIQYIGIIEER